MFRTLKVRLVIVLVLAILIPVISFVYIIYVTKTELNNHLHLILALCAGSVIFLSLLLIHLTIAPLKKLQAIVYTIKEQKKPLATNFSGPMEIVSLFHAVNEMAVALDEHGQLREKTATLTILAQTDGLTGLYNYRYFHEQLSIMLAESEKTGRPLSLVMLDIDDFKYCNDFLGHLVGDEVIKIISLILRDSIGLGNIAARYGGDEFALLLPGHSLEEATLLAKRIQQAVENYPFRYKNRLPKRKLSVSSGIATYPISALDKKGLVKFADQELFNTKNYSHKKIGQYISVFHSLKNDIDGSKEELIRFARLMLSIINAKDKYTYYHTERVVRYAVALAGSLGLSLEEINRIRLGALLHDIGKLEISANVLNKKSPLTEGEWAIIKQHSRWGAEMLAFMDNIDDIVATVRHHHERYDGKGYPDRLAEEGIPIGARILAVADSFDAMISHRPYRTARILPDALLELERHSGTQFDPIVVKAFRAVVEDVI